MAKNVLQISKDENNSNEVAITYSMESKKYIQRGEETFEGERGAFI